MEFFKAVGIGTVALLGGVVACSLYEVYWPGKFCGNSPSGLFSDVGEPETASEAETKSPQQETGKPEPSAVSAT